MLFTNFKHIATTATTGTQRMTDAFTQRTPNVGAPFQVFENKSKKVLTFRRCVAIVFSMKVIVERLEENLFSVVTDVPMSDGSFQADYRMKLVGNVLRSHEEPHYIRVGGLLKFTLGPISFAYVKQLPVGGSRIIS